MALARHPNVSCRAEAVAALGNINHLYTRHHNLNPPLPRDLQLELVIHGKVPEVLRQHATRALKNLTTSDETKRLYDSEYRDEEGQFSSSDSGGEAKNNDRHRATPSTIQGFLRQAVSVQASPRTSDEFQNYGRDASGSTYGVGRKTMDEYAEAAARRAAASQINRVALERPFRDTL